MRFEPNDGRVMKLKITLLWDNVRQKKTRVRPIGKMF